MFAKLLAIALLPVFCWSAVYAQLPNTLTSQEKRDGWRLLFDGRDFKGWHVYQEKGKKIGSSWRIDEGSLNLNVPKRIGVKSVDGGDLVTDAAFTGDFEVKAEWKVEKFTNSGLFLFVQEAPRYKKSSTPAWNSNSRMMPSMMARLTSSTTRATSTALPTPGHGN